MNNSATDLNDIHQDHINYWLKHPRLPITLYREPMLEEGTIEVIKLFCDVLQQTDEVFIETVDVVEEYIHKMYAQKAETSDSLLIIASAVLMTSKLIGSHPEIKITSIQAVISKLTKTHVDRNVIKKNELDIFLTLGKLPLTTIITDLTTFLEYYIKNLKLNVNIESLCLEILNIVYISKKSIFYQLKSTYTQTREAFFVFKHLICNRLYFPGGIVLCALRVTKFKNFLDLNQIAQDIEAIATIHYDHLQLLAGTIYEFLD